MSEHKINESLKEIRKDEASGLSNVHEHFHPVRSMKRKTITRTTKGEAS